MFYTIYKITNLINGKFYIGKHQTNNLNDDYFGSGKILRAAIKKYGIENFKKEILEVYDQEWKMNLAEKIYVVVDQEVSYNICPGGKGGWGYVNNEIWSKEKRHYNLKNTSRFKHLTVEERKCLAIKGGKAKFGINKTYWFNLYEKYKNGTYKSISQFVYEYRLNHCSSVVSKMWKRYNFI